MKAPAGGRGWSRGVLAALLLWGVLGGLIVGASGAGAASVPYTDSYSNGVIGLCDHNNQPITHGNINDHPFAWLAVSSSPAPAGFTGYGMSATLYAYQVRQGVDPGYFTGDQITAASYYTNIAHPMVAASADGSSVADVIKQLPLQWDGLIELRMYFGAPGVGIHNDTYPETDIQVVGDTWTVVRGGTVSCTAGFAVSAVEGGPPASSATASPAPAPGARVSAGAGPSPGSSQPPRSAPGGTGASAGAAPKAGGRGSAGGGGSNLTGQVAVNRASGAGGPSATAALIVVSIGLLGLGAGGFLVMRHHRRSQAVGPVS